MINLLKILILKLFSMLPDSPFTAYFESVDFSFYDHLNWFLPLDVCSDITKVWLVCVVIYYIWVIVVKKIVIAFTDKIIPVIIAFFL